MKVHLNLAVRDLDASVAFRRVLLNARPARHYTDVETARMCCADGADTADMAAH